MAVFSLLLINIYNGSAVQVSTANLRASRVESNEGAEKGLEKFLSKWNFNQRNNVNDDSRGSIKLLQ